MISLAINPYHPDSSSAIADNEKLIAFAKEADLINLEHYSGFPSSSISHCLKTANSRLADIDYIVISKNPFVYMLERFIVFLKTNPLSASKRLNSNMKIAFLRRSIQGKLSDTKNMKAKIVFVEHHKAHLADAYYNSGLDNALILTCDGSGDMTTAMWGIGEGSRLTTEGRIRYPHSLGLMYSAFTQFLGFSKYGEEYKTTELAPLGEPVYKEKIKKIIKNKKHGSFTLDLSYFDFFKKGILLVSNNGSPFLSRLYSEKFCRNFGRPRQKEEKISDYHRDISASLQSVLEETILTLLYNLKNKYDKNNLCLSGGVFANPLLCERIKKSDIFKRVHISSQPSDINMPTGALLYFYNMVKRD